MRKRRVAVLLVLICGVAAWYGFIQLAKYSADADLRSGNFAGASSWIEVGLRFSPNQPDLNLLDLRMARKLGDTAGFSGRLNALQQQPALKQQLALEVLLLKAAAGELDELESQLSTLLINGTEPDEVCESFVLGCLLNYRLPDAESVVEVWLADFPDDPRAHFLSGRLLQHRENLPAAREAYQRAVDLGHGPAGYALTEILKENQEFEAAVQNAALLEKRLYDPQPALVMQARVLRAMQRFPEARARLKKAETSSPEAARTAWRLVGEPAEEADGNVLLELAELDLAEGALVEAERGFREVLARNPQRWRVRHSLATALRLQGKLSEAAEESEKYSATMLALRECDRLIDHLRSEPEDVTARYQVAETLMDHVSERQGVVWLQTVLRYDPGHRASHERLAQYFEKHEDENPAFKTLVVHHRSRLRE